MLAWQQMNPMALFGDPAITQYPSALSAQARLSEINLNLPKQCFYVTAHLTGIEVFSSCPVLRWDAPSVPLPTHSEQSKPKAQAGKICYDPLGLGSDKAQFRKHTEVCVWPIYRYRAIKRPQLTLDREVLYRDCTRLKKIIDAPSH